MSSKLLLPGVVVLLLLAACNHSASKYRVKTMYHLNKEVHDGKEYMNDTRTDTFYYTAEGKRDPKLAGITSKTESNGNMAIVKDFDKSGKLLSSTTTFLNDRGFEDSTYIWRENQNTFAHKYTYDDKGYLIEDRQYTLQPPPVMISKYIVVDGNRVEERHGPLISPSIDTITMINPVTMKVDTVVQKYFDVIFHNEFFTDKLNMPANENFGYTNRDLHSKNLMKKQVELSDKGDTSDVSFFRYNFDDKGRVVSTAIISRIGQYDSTSYTYY